jgi:hypothetical protein
MLSFPVIVVMGVVVATGLMRVIAKRRNSFKNAKEPVLSLVMLFVVVRSGFGGMMDECCFDS